MIEPLRMEFDVRCPAGHAFDLWTQRPSSWWPLDHTVTGEAGLQVVFEGRVGGRIFERTPSGREVEWGEITVWEPPRRLCYQWYIRSDRADATEVEIRFKRKDADHTRVQIEHRGWERLGTRATEWRDANRSGWNGVLPDYIAVCAAVRRLDRSRPDRQRDVAG
jgi:uncharacterized protein YndB with AHSA1/START domain